MENHFTFTKPFDVQVKADGRVVMEGEISNTEKDLVNDICTKHCLISMESQINKGNMKLDLEHEAFRGDDIEEKEINKTKIPIGKITKAEVVNNDRGGFSLMVKAELNRNHARFEETKNNLIEKYLDAYSIAFIPTETKTEEINGEQVRLLDDDRLLNVALTGNPVNTTAQIKNVVMKSLDALEEYKKEKKSNPKIMQELEVKAKEEDTDEEEDDEDEEKKKKEKKKYPGKKTNDPLNASHLDKENIQKEVKMSEENTENTKPEESEEATEEATETKDESTESTEAGEEGAKEEAATEEAGDVEGKSMVDLKSAVIANAKVIKSNSEALKAIQEILKMPIHKSLAMPQDKSAGAKEKSVNPLDAI